MKNDVQISNYEIFNNIERQWGENREDDLNKSERSVINKYVRKTDKILEAGCGGGRISINLQLGGFENIDAFDFVEDFIEKAKRSSKKVKFFIADASDLQHIPDETYDVCLYLQRILCFLPHERMEDALYESYRILSYGGIMICSVLVYETRWINNILGSILTIIRKLRGDKLSKQELPWLKLNNKINISLFKKNQATVYWFKREEIKNYLEIIGYEIVDKFVAYESPTIEFYICKK